MSVIRIARKLLSLPGREIADLIRAQGAILVATWKLRRVRIGDLVTGGNDTIAGISVNPESHTRVNMPENASFRAAELALAVVRVAEFGISRPACLIRSIALRNLLSDAGIGGSIIRVGVRRDAEEFVAHAWVELEGNVIGDDAGEVARFTPLNSLGVRAIR